MAPPSIWPAWVRYTATAALSGGAVLVAMTLSFADVRANAARGAALESRVRSLEDALMWVKAALRTGRDPDTGAPLPFVK